MASLHYDAERGCLLIQQEFRPSLVPEMREVQQEPLYLFPLEAAPCPEGYTLPARADVVARLRALYPRPETPEFKDYARQFQLQRETEIACLTAEQLAIPYLPNYLKELYPIQTKAIDCCLRNRFVLLAMDMGLGKTITSLYAMQCMLADRTVRRWLIISPVSGIDDAWYKEMAEAQIPYTVCAGGKSVHSANTPFVIVGREQLVTDLALKKTTFEQIRQQFDGYCLDESSVVKDEANTTTAVLRQLRHGAQAMLFLNGTPIENTLKELWTQLDVLYPGQLGTWKQFKLRHGISEDSKPTWPQVMALLQGELLGKLFVARLADIGKEIPPLYRKTIWVRLTPAQQAAYDGLEAQYRQERDPGQRLALYTRMQQVCDDLGLIGEGYAPGGASAKKEFLRQLLPGLASFDRKSLIYSQFREWSLALAREFSGANALTYLGGMSRQDRVGTRVAFKETEEPYLWVNDAALKSLNLQYAWNVVNLDLPWSGSIFQLVARALRGDTDHPVYWLRVLSDTPLERKKLALVETKRELLDGAIRSLPEAIQSGLLTEEELL